MNNKIENPLMIDEKELVNILFFNNSSLFISKEKKLNFKGIKIELHSLVKKLKEKNNINS
jgi:hypothetical protein